MTNQRMKWDAEAAFESLNEAPMGEQYERDEIMTVPYAPPSNIGPERLAQLRKYEPPAKHGRDIGSLMRYHEAHKKGRTDDDCLAEKFGEKMITFVEPSAKAAALHAPTPPQSADGPWPKRIMGAAALGILEGPHNGTAYYRGGSVVCISCKGVADSWLNALQGSYRLASESEALQWLEQNGHADVAAQLRGTPRDDVATGGGRVWKRCAVDVEVHYALIGGALSHNCGGEWRACNSYCVVKSVEDAVRCCTELFGTERDAILSECREVMGL